MRKTSYVVTFLWTAAVLVLNVLTSVRPDWLIVKVPEVLNTKFTLGYGLSELCTYKVYQIPDPSKGETSYSEYTCRNFPTKQDDSCDDKKRVLCASWTTAGYFVELAIGFGAISLVAIIFGVSSGSRRRRIWRAVAGLLLIQAIFQLVSFCIVSHMYRTSRFPTFQHARPGTSFVLNIVSWVVGLVVAIAVITTGISADKGHRWAAGNRAYRRIEG